MVCTDGPEEKWSSIARLPLGSKHVFRSSQFIDGQWAHSTDMDSWVSVVDPANKQVFHAIPAGTGADIEAAVAAAKKALPGWSATPVVERARILKLLAEKLKENSAELAEYETVDNGKPLKESVMDVADAAACFEVRRAKKKPPSPSEIVLFFSVLCRRSCACYARGGQCTCRRW